ncbi:Aspartic protease in GUARD CELL-like protein [Melia azedarach]|uniref:Aspartic protease in GUARD CELL-like protein n=1 Tax=Melia azedarach TaxID=155640 RepID=A0ACC1XRL0_MELAZ|nr:Aspartic protease in GUARD CELL-like protein [Melia azedarach]
MAASKPFFLFSILLLFSVFTSTFSRSLLETTTTVLDVSSALQQTQEILSFDPETVKPFATETITESSFNSSSSFSLPLHSRELLRIIQHEDYKSLVLSRLERDSARVNSLVAKLQLAVNNVDKQQLKPVGTQILPEDLTTPVVSGASQGSGEYFSRVGVGSPPKQFSMVLDTGSDINWLQCQPCTDCYQQSDPIFDPRASSTYRPLSCNAPQCGSLDVSACRANRCLYQVSYGDGSYTVGEFVMETVSFGNSGAMNGVALGCGHDNEGLFVGAAGLLGLGGGSLSLTNQIKAKSFAYCLVDRDSTKSGTLEFNSAQAGDLVTAPLIRSKKIDTFYYVGLTGFSVGGHVVQIPPSLFQMDDSGAGGIIVDCGTAITRLQTQAYNSLRDSFVKLTPNLKSTSGVALFDTCYDFSGLPSVKVPTLSFHFAGGKSLDLPAKNYLIPVDSDGTFCFAFAPTTSSMSIIGNVQQQGTRVSFDLANNRVGFSPNKC